MKRGRILGIGVIVGLALIARPAYRSIRYERTMERFFDNGHLCLEVVLDRWTGTEVHRVWYETGHLWILERHEGDFVEAFEWYDKEPDSALYRQELKVYRRGVFDSSERIVEWNYDGTINCDRSGTFAGGRKLTASEAHVRPEHLARARHWPIDKIIAYLAHENPIVRAQAARSAGYRRNPIAIPHLAKLLTDPNEQVREWSALALGEMGPDASPCVPDLESLLRRGDIHSPQVWDALASIDTPRAAEALAALALDPDVWVIHRLDAIRGLGRLRMASAHAISPLLELMGQTSLRLSAIAALGELGAQASPAVPSLVAMLESDSLKVHPGDSRFLEARELCAELIDTLGLIGPSAQDAIPALSQLVLDAWRSSAAWSDARAIAALMRIDPEGKNILSLLEEALARPGAYPPTAMRQVGDLARAYQAMSAEF